jgi:hypothetical protein
VTRPFYITVVSDAPVWLRTDEEDADWRRVLASRPAHAPAIPSAPPPASKASVAAPAAPVGPGAAAGVAVPPAGPAPVPLPRPALPAGADTGGAGGPTPSASLALAAMASRVAELPRAPATRPAAAARDGGTEQDGGGRGGAGAGAAAAADDDDDDGVDDDLKFKLPAVEVPAEKRKGGGFVTSAAGIAQRERAARLAAIQARETEWRVRGAGRVRGLRVRVRATATQASGAWLAHHCPSTCAGVFSCVLGSSVLYCAVPPPAAPAARA